MNDKSAAAAARATVYGYPRQGPDRELKKAIEGYWKGRVSAEELESTAASLRRDAWRELATAGADESVSAPAESGFDIQSPNSAVGEVRGIQRSKLSDG